MSVDEIEREYYLKGTPLPEYLVEMAEIGENQIEHPTQIGDIQAGFPEEDFLDTAILDLDCIIEQMHGNNKALPALKDLSILLGTVRNTVNQSAEYGRDELRKLEESLGV